jgi:hypothetical protein
MPEPDAIMTNAKIEHLKMSAIKAMVLAVGLLLAASAAGAMSGLEFLDAYDKSATEQHVVMAPLVRQFISEGYHDVPDWSDLADETRALILKKGYRDKDIVEIAREAAIAKGMSKEAVRNNEEACHEFCRTNPSFDPHDPLGMLKHEVPPNEEACHEFCRANPSFDPHDPLDILFNK